MSTNYTLKSAGTQKGPHSEVTLRDGLRRFIPLMEGEGRAATIALLAILVSSGASLLAPILIGHGVDDYIRVKDGPGLMRQTAILIGVYLIGVIGSYTQVRTMGAVGRRLLYRLRNALFSKLQELPVAFFNQNKAGDLISRLNNDTDKLNQFIAQALMQFMGNIFMICGAGILLLSRNIRLGSAAVLPGVVVLVITRLTGAWVRRKNLKSLQGLGGMSAEVQESINNFKVVVAFNRLDYFRSKFERANQVNYESSTSAGYANNLFIPLYGLASMLAQLVVIVYGIHLIQTRDITLGVLISFLLYVNNFYFPLRQLAAIWSSFQMGLAAIDRISDVLALESNMPIAVPSTIDSNAVLSFRNVTFAYPGGKQVLHDATLDLEQGKAYALVGPTGGGKTTTAYLMARLYDPAQGSVYLNGRDIRSFTPEERTRKIGFILQDPFLFSGTVRDNITYGNEEYQDMSTDQFAKVLADANLTGLIDRFSEGLETKVVSSGNSISLGQKQLIAFMRAALRKPDLLILDEATANIDTITEQLLEEILAKLPATTTKVIIAHRLNTIDNVDQIFFVNACEILQAGSMEHAVDMLLHGRRAS
jgi:ATP-binding cassette, subfamily B, bacterial